MENRKPNLIPLSPPDSLHLDAAEGWLALGNDLEANEELEKITAGSALTPMYWSYAGRFTLTRRNGGVSGNREGNHPACAERPFGLIHMSYALHELGRTREAWENLLLRQRGSRTCRRFRIT